MNGARKAAILLMGVGDAVSAEVLRQLSPEEVRRITTEIAATPAVVSEQFIAVFREFEARTSEGRFFAKGGVDCAKRLVEQAFGSDSPGRLLESSADPGDVSAAGLLRRTDPQQLVAFLRNENPQTIAVLLCSVPGKTGAELLSSLPEEMQRQVAVRMAFLDRVSPEAFQRISEAIGQKVRNARRMERPDGIRALASLLNHIPGEHADALLGHVGEQDERAAADVRSRMFLFEDILTIGAEGMKALIAGVDRKILTVALKGTSAKVRTHITAQMSQRAAEMLAEDMEALGPVRVRDVKAAQDEIVAMVRKLQKSGALAAGGEEYVV